jgi:endothelin-converting enzyme/putative endopeptidase
MRRLSLVWFGCSIPALALAAACGGSPDAPAATPAAPPPAPVASAPPAAPAAHAPAPPTPPGVEEASMDTSASPCDDFFQYSCGGWIKANPIPDDQARWSRFDTLAEDNMKVARDILERDATNPPADEAYSKALGDYYGSCMDEAGVEKDGLRGLAPELARIDGVKDITSLSREIGRLHTMGVHPYFLFSSDQDYKDATQEIAALDQRGLGLPDRDYYLKDDAKTVSIRDKYVAHVERVFGLLGDKPDVAKKEAAAVFALEKALATDQMPRVDHRDPDKTYHRMTPADLAKLAHTFKWDVYFKEVGAPPLQAINVVVPDYVASFDKHFAGATKDTWASEVRPYLRYTVIRSYAEDLPKKFVDEDFAFRKELTGQEKIDPRWKRCVRSVDAGMGEALAIPYVKQKFGTDGKQATEAEVKAIEAAMQADLQQVAWMDAATRGRALDKVHKIANMIGFPDKWRNYDALKIDRKSNAANSMRAAQFETKRELGKIGKPVDRAEWNMTPPTVNAYYNPSMNEMVFPAGILQPPFFSVTRPQPVNMGGIGMVMGHELTHGFDDEGRKFDGDGNLTDWWTPSVSADFDKRASCVSDQFDGYVAIDDVHVNGKLTIGENLADLGGLKLTLAALRASGAPGATSPEADRQVFIGYAQVWCGASRPEFSRMLARVDPHSPPRWRVNGPLSNMPDFANAFSCQAGDAMVRPADKQCAVW